METLFTPWRYAYISRQVTANGCFLCQAGEDPDNPERLVVHRARHHVVLLNRHPYSNGHLMVTPRQHLASPGDSRPEARSEFWPLVLQTQEVLEAAYAPDGFNLGLNLGSAAGAGVPSHFHFHVVPRWSADTNFMSVLGQVRVIPEDLEAVWTKLRDSFSQGGN